MANEQFGPLAALIGTWEGDQGVNVSYDYDKKEIIEEPYRETVTFNIVGDATNGDQVLWVLDYQTFARRPGEDDFFHTELGYWLWDSAREEVMRCFMVPRGSAILAGGTCAANATKFELNAKVGQEAFGVLSNPYLLENAKCVEYQLSCTIEDDTWTYHENTIMEMSALGTTMDHTDANTLKRVK